MFADGQRLRQGDLVTTYVGVFETGYETLDFCFDCNQFFKTRLHDRSLHRNRSVRAPDRIMKYSMHDVWNESLVMPSSRLLDFEMASSPESQEVVREGHTQTRIRKQEPV